MRRAVVAFGCVFFSLVHHADAAKMRVAVLTFQSGSGSEAELENLGAGLQSMVTTDLASAQVFDLVERSRLKDLQAELKLSVSAMVDPTTAVKLGRLAGATHLVTGSYVVVGKTMRLDARMVSVQDGRVVLAATIEGTREGFFELEKDLVGRLIKALGVTLGARERGEVSRIHTTDFDAFREFSQGVALFDAQKYDDALAALHKAENRDHRFELATSTVAEYERIVAELRSKATAIEAAQVNVERAESDAKAHEILERGRRAAAVVAKKNGTHLQKLAALRELIEIYDGGHGGSPDDHDHLAKYEDDFALHRTAHPFWRAYVAEWLQVFPKVDVGLGDDRANPNEPKFALYQVLGSLLRVKEVSRAMLLDLHEEAELRKRVTARSEKLFPDVPDQQGDRRKLQLALAENLSDIGDYAGSVEIYTRLAAREKDPGQLKELANRIDANRLRTAILSASPNPDWSRELLLGGGTGGASKERMTTDSLRAKLSSFRALDPCPWKPAPCYMLIGNSPVWMVRDGYVWTGPRTDVLRASELRYWDDGADEPLLIVDGVRRTEVAATVNLSFEQPDDLWRAKGPRVETRRPEVSFAFGMKDIDIDDRRMHGYEIVIASDGVRLEESVDVERHSNTTKRTILAREALDLRGQKRLVVTVRVGKPTISVQVSGKELRFQAPADPSGFYGFRFRRGGYAAVTSWTIDGGAK